MDDELELAQAIIKVITSDFGVEERVDRYLDIVRRERRKAVAEYRAQHLRIRMPGVTRTF